VLVYIARLEKEMDLYDDIYRGCIDSVPVQSSTVKFHTAK
jgi:hypothetical protein